MALQRLREACEAYEDRDDEDEEAYLLALEDIRDAAFAVVYGSVYGCNAPPFINVTLTPHEQLPFTFENIDYRTAFNAFQAQKAPPEKRSEFSKLCIQEATDLGRTYTIDTATWDSGRKDLMYKIIKSQAYQHDDLKQRILEHGDTDNVGKERNGSIWYKIKKIVFLSHHKHIQNLSMFL